LDRDTERDWFPDADPLEEELREQRIRRLAAKALSLGLLKERLDAIPPVKTKPVEQTDTAMMEALRQCYAPLWEVALQRWMEAVAPGPRTYVRPARRNVEQSDVVLAGRRREGWTLHVVLDTSGSMVSEIPRVLGAISVFCEGAGITTIHILQCDVR